MWLKVSLDEKFGEKGERLLMCASLFLFSSNCLWLAIQLHYHLAKVKINVMKQYRSLYAYHFLLL